MKYNIITHLTTSCNYDCSYCDVVKDKRMLSTTRREYIIKFIQKNEAHIERFKFFGGEPFLAFKDMKYIIDETYNQIGNNYEVVTNTTLLNDKIGKYLETYFSHIFFSIDSENDFSYEKVFTFTEKYNLEKKLYFNLVISPGQENIALQQFQKLYDAGMRGFNILPVYFTKAWSKQNLSNFSSIMKYIIDISLTDSSLRLYGFMENAGYDTSLANNTIFLDIDGKVYYSDIVSTFLGKTIKSKLELGNVENILLKDIIQSEFLYEKEHISHLEESVYHKVTGQRELHKMMDYFSKYLNTKQG